MIGICLVTTHGRRLTETLFGYSCTDVLMAARFGALSSLLKSDPLPRTFAICQ
jgi:hypothetical protein